MSSDRSVKRSTPSVCSNVSVDTGSLGNQKLPCPKCQLAFKNTWKVKHHLIRVHSLIPDSFVRGKPDVYYPGCILRNTTIKERKTVMMQDLEKAWQKKVNHIEYNHSCGGDLTSLLLNPYLTLLAVCIRSPWHSIVTNFLSSSFFILTQRPSKNIVNPHQGLVKT